MTTAPIIQDPLVVEIDSIDLKPPSDDYLKILCNNNLKLLSDYDY